MMFACLKLKAQNVLQNVQHLYKVKLTVFKREVVYCKFMVL